MTETKWTPGPWRAVEYTEEYSSGFPWYEVHATTNEYDLIVSKCGTGVFQIKENAQLQSAAPEMYEALMGCCAACASVPDGASCNDCDIDKALKKARGE